MMEGDYDIEKLMQAMALYTSSQKDTRSSEYLIVQRNCLNTLLGDPALSVSGSNAVARLLHNNSDIISHFTKLEVSLVKQALSNEEEEMNLDEGGHEEHKGDPGDTPIQSDIDTSPCGHLGKEQNQAFQYILEHVKNKVNGIASDNMMLIVHGGPGVGKSTMAKALVKRLRSFHMEVLSCAPTGIASSLLVDGRTLHSLFKLRVPKSNEKDKSYNKTLPPLNEPQLIAVRETFRDVAVLLVDESSMIDPAILFHMSSRLQQIRNRPHEPFGGMPIVLLGDFFQLKPVKGTAFFDAAMKDVPVGKHASPYAYGRELLKLFTMVTFTEQFRSKDEVHTASINQMRCLDSGQFFTQNILNSFKVLSPEDLEDVTDTEGILHPSPFRTAPIIVTSNRERHEINLSQSQRYGKANGVPILQWRKQIIVSDDVGEVVSDILYEQEPDLTGLFVEGAPAHLTDNMNATSGLANGTPVILHSVLLSDDDDPEFYRQKVASASPGDVINIPVPYAINVEIQSIDAAKFLKKHKSLVAGKVVIPLTYKSDSKNKIKMEDQNIYYKSHSYQIAFGVTFHKIQGQTVPRIILDLNKRPGRTLGSLDFHGLYVGLTRVEYCEHIRILPCHDDDNFKHLLTLKPNSNLKAWLNVVPNLE
jgi:hypothetical protein